MQYYTSPFNKEEEFKFPKDITIYDTTLKEMENKLLEYAFHKKTNWK